MTTRGAIRGLFLVLALSAHVSSAETIRRALVVAFNGSDVAGTAALRFADDDGYRWRETLERLGIETTLLTTPDADTLRLEMGRGAEVLVPSVLGLASAVEALGEKNRLDRELGAQVDVLFIYVGHGQTDALGHSYLTLLDGQLDQKALYEGIVDQVGADFVHLIIDACHAGGVVGSRGADPALLEQLRAALGREQLKSRPHVGALFAESEEGETHEWSRIRAGIFSHAARSALLGGADVNHDGVIAYSELDAFVASSIRGVKGTRARLRLKTSAPLADPNRSLTGPAPRGPTFRLPDEPAFSRLSVEDSDGVRLVDVNRQAHERVVLALPWRPAYWLRTSSGDARVGSSELSGSITLAVAELGSRGSVEESYSRGLFAVPFGPGFFDGYQASQDDAVPLTFQSDVPVPVELGSEARFDGAWFGLGAGVGVPVAGAPLGASGVSGGVSLTLRSDGPLYFGARAQWTLSAGTLEAATIHRVTLGGLVGWRGWTTVAPFVEVGPQWVPTLVFRAAQTQGDWSGFGGRLAVGAQGSRSFLRGLRLAATAELDAVIVDGTRLLSFIPGIELSVTF